jgi:hypothetical protein
LSTGLRRYDRAFDQDLTSGRGYVTLNDRENVPTCLLTRAPRRRSERGCLRQETRPNQGGGWSIVE